MENIQDCFERCVKTLDSATIKSKMPLNAVKFQQKINGSVCMSICMSQEKINKEREKERLKIYKKFTKVKDLRITS